MLRAFIISFLLLLPASAAGYANSYGYQPTETEYPMPLGNFGNFFLSYGKRGFEKNAIYNNYWDSVGGTYSLGDAELYNFFSLEFEGENKKYLLQEKGLESLGLKSAQMSEHFLFPVAYYEFYDVPVRLNLTAFSPFMFYDTFNSTVPAYCFVFMAENPYDKPLSFSLSLNFENDIGWRDNAWNIDGNENIPIENGFYMTYDAEKKRALDKKEHLGNITIKTSEDCSLSQGEIDGRKIAKVEKRVTLSPSESIEIPFIVATCFPLFNPGGKQYGKDWDESWKVSQYFEWYWKNFFDSSREIADYAMENYAQWLQIIKSQSEAVFNKVKEPEVAKLLLNSLHILGSESFYSKEGFFFTIEGEFTLLHTIDVMFYAQPFFVEFFPDIARNIVLEYAYSMSDEGRVPHSLFYDYAENHEEPYFVIMAYMSAKDDRSFAELIYPYVRKAMFFRSGEDVGKDALINNEGADHSYDMWSAPTMSYTNSLWLLALRLTSDLASELGIEEDAVFFEDLFERAQKSFVDELWNEEYFNLSSKRFGNLPWLERRGIEIKVPILDRKASHVEQITGVLFAELLDKQILPYNMSKSATLFVYENNLDRYRELGWINGVFPRGCIDMFAWFPLYSTMVWSGVQWVLAAQLYALGFTEEAEDVASITAENQLYRGFSLFNLGEGYTNLFGKTYLNFPLFYENYVILKPPIYPSYPRVLACWLYYFALSSF
ncbi:MAG: GH116 family glycosyl hydrolase [Candidatus Thermoplasmatota archaeon]|nr:GH116 family glycosyl hydrolase [Candidatus Thermoplasmatota archaeon]